MPTNTLFSLAEFDRMIERDVFDDSREMRMELIRGEIREMSPIGPVHEDIVDILNQWSVLHASQHQIRVRVQNSIGIAELDSAPLPDIVWAKEKSYRQQRPQPGDVLLVAEVSDTSLAYDRGRKLTLYASANIQEYWIVNLQEWSVEVYRDPQGSQYAEKRTYRAGQSISPLAAPSVELAVDELFS